MSTLTTAQTHPPSSTAASTRAVEVVASFGGSVVGVRHVADPKSGATRAMTKAMLAGGASLLAASALAFGYAKSVAADNATAAKAWSDAKKPSWAFRPAMLPRSLDGLMFGGSVLGMAALVWGLSRRKNEQLPSRVRVGSGAGVDFALDSAASFDLVAPQGDGFVCNLVDGMTGELTVGGETRALSVGPVAMTADTRLRVKLGSTMFHVQSVPAPAKTAAAPLFLQSKPLAFIAASAIVHLGAVLFLRNVPSDVDTANGDDDTSEIIQMRGETASIEDKVEEIIPDMTNGSHEAGQSNETSSRMAMESGKSGTDKPSQNPGDRKVKDDGVPPSIARQRAIKAAEIAGILGSESFSQPEMFSSITGTADITSQYDDADIYSWRGPGDGDDSGPFGHGPDGTGPGGGGRDWNSMKTGDYKTIGDGDKTGEGKCLLGKCDDGPGDGKQHVVTAPKGDLRIGKPECKGDAGCDTDIIRRYIKRNSAKISYCYERELLATPSLTGTVNTTFMVAPNGKVTEVTAAGVSKSVSSCVETVIAGIQFPKFEYPFQVNYPFFMHKSGS